MQLCQDAWLVKPPNPRLSDPHSSRVREDALRCTPRRTCTAALNSSGVVWGSSDTTSCVACSRQGEARDKAGGCAAQGHCE